jgi:hypothetical protein
MWPPRLLPLTFITDRAAFCIGFIGFEPRFTVLGGCRALVPGGAVFMWVCLGGPWGGQANIWHAFLGDVLSFGGIRGFVIGLVRAARSSRCPVG